mgnify:CR=1 FL=1
MNHCWKDKSEYASEIYGEWSDEHMTALVEDGTCMLTDGHPGEHEFTPDSQIMITVTEAGLELMT